MKKYNKKRAFKLWKLCRKWVRCRAALHFIPITEDDNETSAIKYAGTNSKYMKKCRLNLKLQDEIAELLFGCSIESVGYELGYDKKYKKKKKNRRED